MPGRDSQLDVVLIHHPTSDTSRPIHLAAMGLFSLADTLNKRGISTEIIHLGVEHSLDPDFDVMKFVEDRSVRIAAMSLHWFFQLPDTLELARRLKEAHPNVFVVLGGFTASFFAREIVDDHDCVDVVVRGDGELPLFELCERLLQDPPVDPRNVPNLAYRSSAGGVEETPFIHAVTEEQLTAFSFSNLELLRHHEEYLHRSSFPTVRFRDRLAPPGSGLFPLETGRGCPYECPFCGGSRTAQMRINNRKKPLHRSAESVLRTIREVQEHGCSNFYVCFDPDPSASYYRDLFRRIRKGKLELRMMFGAWGLPGRSFIDDFRNTFTDGLFEISPETANESLRATCKGPLNFSNAELEERVEYIGENGLATQLFFGYFLPGDTVETVMSTQRYARDLSSDICETFYLAFSTDPGCLMQLRPEEHDIHTEVRDLDDYIEALSMTRVSPNLLAHRPRSMTEDESRRTVFSLEMESFLHKIFPRTIRTLGMALGDRQRAEHAVIDLCFSTASQSLMKESVLHVEEASHHFQELIHSNALGLDNMHAEQLADMLEYEAMPYALMEKHFSKVSTHYSMFCRETGIDESELATFVARSDVAASEHTFRHDVKKIMASVERGELPPPEPRKTTILIAVSEKGQVVSHYRKDRKSS